MKIYVAGKFEDVETVRAVYARLEESGHTISYDWTTHKNIKPYTENQSTAREYAENELTAILSSDVFIYLSHDGGTTMHMEFGAALAKAASGQDIKIFAVGKHNARSPWYFNEHVTRVDNVDEVFNLL